MSSRQTASPSRRQILSRAAIASGAAALASFPFTRFAAAADAGDQHIPFLEPLSGAPGRPILHWDELKDWITPIDQFFAVNHYGPAKVPALAEYALEISGLLDKPRTLSLDDIKKLPKKQITATLECSGNGADKSFCGAIGNATWTGTPLAALLKGCGVSPEAVEVAFWGIDHKIEKIAGAEYDQNFARSLLLKDALREEVLLAYEMNGQPLTPAHGAPLRLVVPGWYGIAWVKWLQRIEVRDHRLMTRFMADKYVTLRGEELADGKIAWKQSSVGPMNLKSMVAKVVRRNDGGITVMGAAWSGMTPLKAVELKIDDGEWIGTTLDDSHQDPYTWRFWTADWKAATPGEHTLVSRAIDAKANIQPTADDPAIKLKKTYYEANQQWPRKIKIEARG